MTRLPHESRQVKPRPDLPEYELNAVDARPGSDAPATENHHLWRRSFGKDFAKAWWVELPDGTVVPNRVGLSNDSHRLITENRARIELELWNAPGTGGEPAQKWAFWWVEQEGTHEVRRLLEPQPGPQGTTGRVSVAADGSEGVLQSQWGMQQTIDGGEVPHEHVVAANGAEKPCPRCKGAGKVLEREKPPKDPDAKPTPKRTWACRVPAGESEDGHAVLEEYLGTAIEKCHDAGLIRDINKGASYYALIAALAYFNTHFDPREVAE